MTVRNCDKIRFFSGLQRNNNIAIHTPGSSGTLYYHRRTFEAFGKSGKSEEREFEFSGLHLGAKLAERVSLPRSSARIAG